MFYVGQRPKYTRTKVGGLAERGLGSVKMPEFPLGFLGLRRFLV